MSAALRLYDLPGEFAAIEREIDESDGELSPDLEARIDALELTLEAKADAIAGLIRSADAESEAVDLEVQRLTARRNAARNRATRLKQYLHDTLDRLGRDRVEGRRFKVRLQRNGSPSIRWTRLPDDLPPEFRRVTIEPDGKAALAAYKAGELPEGFEATVGRHVRIS